MIVKADNALVCLPFIESVSHSLSFTLSSLSPSSTSKTLALSEQHCRTGQSTIPHSIIPIRAILTTHQVVGSKSRHLAPPHRSHLPHPKRFLPLLFLLHFNPRSNDFHPHRSHPPRRLRPFMVRTVSRKLGIESRIKLVEIYSHRFDFLFIRHRHYFDWITIRFLRRIWLRSQSILHHSQSNSLNSRNSNLHQPHRSISQSKIGSRSIRNGNSLYSLFGHVGHCEP